MSLIFFENNIKNENATWTCIIIQHHHEILRQRPYLPKNALKRSHDLKHTRPDKASQDTIVPRVTNLICHRCFCFTAKNEIIGASLAKSASTHFDRVLFGRDLMHGNQLTANNPVCLIPFASSIVRANDSEKREKSPALWPSKAANELMAIPCWNTA